MLTLVVTILGVGRAVRISEPGHMDQHATNLIAANGAALKTRGKDRGTALDIVSLDTRVNELRARVVELHNQSGLAERPQGAAGCH